MKTPKQLYNIGKFTVRLNGLISYISKIFIYVMYVKTN